VKRPKRRGSIKTRIALLVLISWVLPLFILLYYLDVHRRTKDSFESGLRYAAELSFERITKTAAWFENAEAARVFETDDQYPDVNLVVLEREKNRVRDFGNDTIYREYLERDQFQLLQAAEGTGGAFLWASQTGVVYIARSVFSGGQREGTLIAQLNREYLFQYFIDNPFGCKRLNIRLNGVFLGFASANGGNMDITPPGAAESGDMKDASGSVGNGEYALEYTAAMDAPFLIKGYQSIRAAYYLLYIICPLVIVLSIVLYKSMSRPIDRMMNGIREVERGAFGVVVDDSADYEFARLAHAFNAMSLNLRNALEKAKKMDEATRESRLLALRAQINPHFLNNTLEFLNWKARMGDADSVSKMVSALSLLLDGAMGREQGNLLPVSKNLEYADAYLFIISQRFGDNVIIKREIADETLNMPVPPLMLQPILENAVIHGIEPRGGGIIRLSAYTAGGRLIISVSNEGRLGGGQARDERLGIRNVQERLELMYGGKASFSLFEENGAVTARLDFPIER
jgi:two-component system sensor histidine kinase YesM